MSRYVMTIEDDAVIPPVAEETSDVKQSNSKRQRKGAKNKGSKHGNDNNGDVEMAEEFEFDLDDGYGDMDDFSTIPEQILQQSTFKVAK